MQETYSGILDKMNLGSRAKKFIGAINPVSIYKEIKEDDELRVKYGKFGKNAFLAIIGSIGGGIGGAELTSEFTDSESIISLGSTAAQYIVSYAVFLPLHARDNLDLYTEAESGKFEYKKFSKDMMKMAGSFVGMDIAYFLTRPAFIYSFLKNNVDPANASVYTDLIYIPLFLAIGIPALRKLGIIRKSSET